MSVGSLFFFPQSWLLCAPSALFPAPYVPLLMNPAVPGDTEGHAHKDAIFFSMHKFLGGVQTPGELLPIIYMYQDIAESLLEYVLLWQKKGKVSGQSLYFLAPVEFSAIRAVVNFTLSASESEVNETSPSSQSQRLLCSDVVLLDSGQNIAVNEVWPLFQKSHWYNSKLTPRNYKANHTAQMVSNEPAVNKRNMPFICHFVISFT